MHLVAQVKAVDSEYEEGLQSDTARIDAICTSLLQPDHPYNMFPCGNKHSLTVSAQHISLKKNLLLDDPVS